MTPGWLFNLEIAARLLECGGWRGKGLTPLWLWRETV